MYFYLELVNFLHAFFKLITAIYCKILLQETSKEFSIEHLASIEELHELAQPSFVKKFSKMPESKPKNVCFDYPVSQLH